MPLPTIALPDPVSGQRLEFAGASGRLAMYTAADMAHAAPLLLVHSINAAGSAYEIKPLYEQYRRSRTVYALELPGFGHSERGKRAYSVRMMTDAIHAARAHIAARHGDAPLDALAVSLSCEFLARAIAEQPANYRSVALVSPTGFTVKPRGAGRPGGTRAKPWLHALFEQPLWSGALWKALVSRASIRFFLKKTWGSANIDEGLADYDYLTTHQPGAQHAPYYFVSGYLFSDDILDIYRSLALPVWMVHGVRGDFTDYTEKKRVADLPNWHIEIMQTGAMPHFELRDEFIAAYDIFLAST